MKLTIHLVSHVAPSSEGGLEMWTARFAQRLSASGARVIVYVCSEHFAAPDPAWAFELVPLAPLRSVWEDPIDLPVWTERIAQEHGRLTFLVLRNEISRRLAPDRDRRDLLISNYAVSAGYLAALVARDLALPHIAMFVGTDFSRGFRNSRERPTINHVCRTATAVVVKNSEQEHALTAEYGLRAVCRIPTSVASPPAVRRTRSPGDPVTLLSDCGFSFKKGTGVLIDSFQTLLAEGLPVRLVIYGGIAKDQLDYWTRRLDDLKRTSSTLVDCPGNVARDTVHGAFQSADIFCSATLGEGSSSGRIAAVCAGLPVVTTRCGEMAAGMDGVSHVRLANVADAADFLDHLRAMVRDILDGRLRIDTAVVERWKSIYAEEREAAAWHALIRSVTSGP